MCMHASAKYKKPRLSLLWECVCACLGRSPSRCEPAVSFVLRKKNQRACGRGVRRRKGTCGPGVRPRKTVLSSPYCTSVRARESRVRTNNLYQSFDRHGFALLAGGALVVAGAITVLSGRGVARLSGRVSACAWSSVLALW